MTKRQIEVIKKDPIKQCFQLVAKTFFPEHPYSLSSIGTAESLSHITPEQCKESFKKDLNEKEMLFFYSGPQSLEKISSKISEITEDLPPRAKKKTKGHRASSENQNQFLQMEREQFQIFLGHPTKNFQHPESLFYKILSSYYSGQSSELFVQLRDVMGLCYTAQPIHFSALECGYWGVYMATGTEKVQTAIVELEKMISNLRKNGIDPQEFSRIKSIIHGQALLGLQSHEDYANIYCVPTLHSLGVEQFYQEQEQIQNYSYEKFCKQLKSILKRPMTKFAVGPFNPFQT